MKDPTEAAERQELTIGGADDYCDYYVPKDFDDPQMTAGRHKQVSTESFLCSIIDDIWV